MLLSCSCDNTSKPYEPLSQVSKEDQNYQNEKLSYAMQSGLSQVGIEAINDGADIEKVIGKHHTNLHPSGFDFEDNLLV